MYFITVDGAEILGLHAGDKDYVHRITGEMMPGARQIPAGSLKITEADYQKIIEDPYFKNVEWDGTQVVYKNLTSLQIKIEQLLEQECANWLSLRRVEVEAMTEAEVDAAMVAAGLVV